MSELEIIEPKKQKLANRKRNYSVLELPYEEMIKEVGVIAKHLKKAIQECNMVQSYGDRSHVTIDGWNMLGEMVGIVPDEEVVQETKPGEWYAKVVLRNKYSGEILSHGSAIASKEEAGKSKLRGNQIRSTAITLATVKAYRMKFSWILKLAGYEGTPAEEMEGVFETNESKSKPISESDSQRNNISRPEKKSPALETFDETNQKHLERLEKVLVTKSIPPNYHIDIAMRLNGQPMSMANIDKIISETQFNG